MSLPVLGALVIVILALGYRFYGGLVARRFRLDPEAPTPAHRLKDGADFVPTRPFYLFGQHFSAIAAAGPIAGPILACGQFGWMPCLLWIAIGVVFIGAVHDISTLVASVRHDARSICEVARRYMGARAALALTIFIWVALVYVIVAFTQVTAATFTEGGEELQAIAPGFNPGGAVAIASALYLALAVVMGVVERLLAPPLWLQTAIFVPATLGVVWLGTELSTVLVLDFKTWAAVILAYCFVASLTPVWALLQPRGYLGGFVLYLALAAGTIGIFFGGYEIAQPAFKGFVAPGPTGALFPFLFVTIACGACSGFHGLVCSGTTSKQIASESHCRPVGYGAMLLEGFVALIALATIMIVAPTPGKPVVPGAVYGNGLGRFLTVVIGDDRFVFARTFGAMAFSTFVFDTLDVSTRLGRYLLQELFGGLGRAGAIVATAVTCAVPLAFVLASDPRAYLLFWTLFGASNQLLAALSLLGVSVWLKRSGRPYWYTAAPMAFVLGITLWSLASLARTTLLGPAGGVMARLNGVLALALIGLAVALLVMGAKKFRPGPVEIEEVRSSTG